MELNKHCNECFEYHRMDCAGVYTEGEPKCYRFRPAVPEPQTVTIPFKVGTPFGFIMSYVPIVDKKRLPCVSITKPTISIGVDNEIEISAPFENLCIKHTIENYNKLRELGNGYLTLEECKEKYPNAIYSMDGKPFDIETMSIIEEEIK